LILNLALSQCFASIYQVFLARDSITCYSALYAIAHLSVCLSHGWISQQWLKLESCNFHHRVAP